MIDIWLVRILKVVWPVMLLKTAYVVYREVSVGRQLNIDSLLPYVAVTLMTFVLSRSPIPHSSGGGSPLRKSGEDGEERHKAAA